MKSSGSGPIFRPLYGVWIDEALQKGDVNEMKAVLQEAKKHFPPPPRPQPLYAVWIHDAIQRGAAHGELQQLLQEAKATVSGDLHGAIQKLEQYLGTGGGKSSTSGTSSGASKTSTSKSGSKSSTATAGGKPSTSAGAAKTSTSKGGGKSSTSSGGSKGGGKGGRR